MLVEAAPDGYEALVQFADEHPGLRAWAIEGTGGYGAGLARHLARGGELVVELGPAPPDPAARPRTAVLVLIMFEDDDNGVLRGLSRNCRLSAQGRRRGRYRDRGPRRRRWPGRFRRSPRTAAAHLVHPQPGSVSCASAGNCSAGGVYDDAVNSTKAFVISQVNGTWGGVTVLGDTLNVGKQASANSVSCASAGKCSAGGTYTDGFGNPRGFVASQS